MGRHISPLAIDRIEPALDCLQKALNRKATIFSGGLKETGRSLARATAKQDVNPSAD